MGNQNRLSDIENRQRGVCTIMEHEFEPDKDKKHQQAQDSLNDLQRVL